ncbi:hypothetical protein CEXT_154861 [Caerostris extrusa]|uniref:Uncharacterized protein n=1 Tax=Caerostris extrusa TaxID=172846 RepID=A0AAV4XZ80_CAEEX|nr:hypothetical protein CEXT_154861 [Caerostris extrusa]
MHFDNGIEDGHKITFTSERKPRYKNPFEKDNQFNVKHPEQLSATAIEQIEVVLPPRLEYIIQDNATQASLSSVLHESSTNQRYKQAYEDDDERYWGFRGVQCQTH